MKASALAALVAGVLHGQDREFQGVAPLDSAGPQDLAFTLAPPRVTPVAGVLLAAAPVDGCSTVVVSDPKLAFMQLLEVLFPEIHPRGVQAGAFVDPSARVSTEATVYPGAYVGAEVEVGPGAVIFPNAVLLARTVVGAGCVVGPGAVVGHAGFGVHPTPQGLVAVPQVGRVVLEAGARVGANTCVDRAFLNETRVGARTQIDNLVQVGHNCRLGSDCVVVAQTGLSGSVVLEDRVVLGGQAGVADHVRIGEGSVVGAQAGVPSDLPANGRWLGTPALPARETARIWAAWKELPGLIRKVRRLEQELGRLQAERGLQEDRSQEGAPR